MPVKWMERPRASEMDRGRASEMNRQKKCHKNKNATEMNKILWNFLGQVFECVIKLDKFQWHFIFVALYMSIRFRGTSSFYFFGTWSVHPFYRHFLYCFFSIKETRKALMLKYPSANPPTDFQNVRSITSSACLTF